MGNQNIDNYQYLSPIKNTYANYFFGEYFGPNGVYNGDYNTIWSNNWGAYPSQLGNLGVTWETSEQTNIGFDARLLSNRLSVNFDFYLKTTRDWLVKTPIPARSNRWACRFRRGRIRGCCCKARWNYRV